MGEYCGSLMPGSRLRAHKLFYNFGNYWEYWEYPFKLNYEHMRIHVLFFSALSMGIAVSAHAQGDSDSDSKSAGLRKISGPTKQIEVDGIRMVGEVD